MLEKCKTAKERWGGVSEIIDSWLESRQALISSFVHLPEQSVTQNLITHLREFCLLSTDYLSSGHFGVYDQLIREGEEFNDGSVEKAQALFPQIQKSTDFALDFNDDYATVEDLTVQDVRTLANRLSDLGEVLEERFALEDQLIAILHTSHSQVVNSDEASSTEVTAS
ncbi:MAG: sigma D regulator [Pontibacterium sp.]